MSGSALERFKRLLIPGARFNAKFPTLAPSDFVEPRVVSSVTETGVEFVTSGGITRTLTFPAAERMIEKDGTFSCLDARGEDVVVTYIPDGQGAPPTDEAKMARVIAVLEGALARDPAALHQVLFTSVPCNEAMADHPTIPVTEEPQGGYSLRGLGLLNGVLEAALGGEVSAVFEESTVSEELLAKLGSTKGGLSRLVGFVSRPPSTSVAPRS